MKWENFFVVLIFIIILVIVIFKIRNLRDSSDSLNRKYTNNDSLSIVPAQYNDQVTFQTKLCEFKDKYSKQPNKIQASDIYIERNAYCEKFVEDNSWKFRRWKGKIISMDVKMGGDPLNIEIVSNEGGCDIRYRNSLLNPIKRGSTIYNQLRNFLEGDQIFFDGELMKAFSNPHQIAEPLFINEHMSMNSTTFIVKFSNFYPIKNNQNPL